MLNRFYQRFFSLLLCTALVWTAGEGAHAVDFLTHPFPAPLSVLPWNFLHNEEKVRLETQAMSLQMIDSAPMGAPAKFPFLENLIDRSRISLNHAAQSVRSSPFGWFTGKDAVAVVFLGVMALTHGLGWWGASNGVLQACGLVGLIWKLDPNGSLWKQLVQIKEYLWRVLDAVASRGPQAAGITLFVVNRKFPFIPNRNGEVVAKRFRMVNQKRIALSRLMTGVLVLYVFWLYMVGYRPLPYVEVFGHVRFATGGPPGVRETHLLRFGPPEKQWNWEFDNSGQMVRRQQTENTLVRRILPAETQVGHNGDLDEWYVYGRWIPQAELKLWLQKVFHLENDNEVKKTLVDSFTAAGLTKLLLTQRSWAAAVRMSNALFVADNENGPFPDLKALEALAEPFERAFLAYQQSIQTRNLSSFADFTEEDAARLTDLLMSVPMPGIPDAKKRQFIESSVYGFLFMNPNIATRFLMQRAKGSASNSFAFEVINPLFPHTVTLAAYKQAVSVAFDPETERITWASEPQGLAARQTQRGVPLPWRMDLRDEGTEGEILEISTKNMRLYSMALGREYSAQELRDQKRIIPNNETNPYWSELPEPPEEGTRVEQSVDKIPKVLSDLRNAMKDPSSEDYKTSVAFSDLRMRRGIYKDIAYKSRVNRIEDYPTLADEIDAKAGEFLESRKANPQASERTYRASVRAYADEVFYTVVAFDFIKVKLRDILAEVLEARAASAGSLLSAAAVEEKLREALKNRLPDPEMVDHLVAGMLKEIQESASLQITEKKGFEGHAEDLALRALDESSIPPARLREVYKSGRGDSIKEEVLEFAKSFRGLVEVGSALDQLVVRIEKLFGKPDAGLIKTTDRNDPDLIIYGHEMPKWMGDHLASLYEKAMPGLHVVVVTGNEFLESVNQSGGIEKRKNDFRVHLRTEHGEYRFGKRTLVIGISQTWQTYPTKNPGSILRDLYKEYGTPHQFIMAGRLDTPGARAVGQIPHPDVEFGDRIWTNLTGWKPEEPKTDVPTAMNFLLSGRVFPFDLLRQKTLFPTYPLFECKVPRAEAQKLWDAADPFVDEEIPHVVGVDAQGRKVPNAGAAQLLKEKGRLWGLRIIEAVFTDILTWILISLAVWVNWNPGHFLPNDWPYLQKLGNWLYYLPFMRWGVPFLIRLVQGRRLFGRRGQPTLAIAGPPHVSKTLEQFVTSVISQQAYGNQSLNVHNEDPQGDFLALFAKRIVSSTLIFLGIPDGRRANKTVGKMAAGMVATQADGIQSFGMGPDIVAVGENLNEKPKGAGASISLGTVPQNHLDPASNLYAELEESIYGSLKLMVSGFVFFTAMAVTVSRTIPWMRYPMDYTQVGAVSTTRSGMPAPNGTHGSGEVDEALPAVPRTPPLSLRALVEKPTSARRLSASELRGLVHPGGAGSGRPETSLLDKNPSEPTGISWDPLYINEDGTLAEKRDADFPEDAYAFLKRNIVEAEPDDEPLPGPHYVIKIGDIDNRAAFFEPRDIQGLSGVIYLDARLFHEALAGNQAAVDALRNEFLEERDHIFFDSQGATDRRALELSLLRAKLSRGMLWGTDRRQSMAQFLKAHPIYDTPSAPDSLAHLYLVTGESYDRSIARGETPQRAIQSALKGSEDLIEAYVTRGLQLPLPRLMLAPAPATTMSAVVPLQAAISVPLASPQLSSRSTPGWLKAVLATTLGFVLLGGLGWLVKQGIHSWVHHRSVPAAVQPLPAAHGSIGALPEQKSPPALPSSIPSEKKLSTGKSPTPSPKAEFKSRAPIVPSPVVPSQKNSPRKGLHTIPRLLTLPSVADALAKIDELERSEAIQSSPSARKALSVYKNFLTELRGLLPAFAEFERASSQNSDLNDRVGRLLAREGELREANSSLLLSGDVSDSDLPIMEFIRALKQLQAQLPRLKAADLFFRLPSILAFPRLKRIHQPVLAAA